MEQTAYDRTVSRVRQVAVDFAKECFRGFGASMRQAESYLPDKNDRSSRILVLDIFVEATACLLVKVVTSYANAMPETEELVLKGVREKFEKVREAQKRATGDAE